METPRITTSTYGSSISMQQSNLLQQGVAAVNHLNQKANPLRRVGVVAEPDQFVFAAQAQEQKPMANPPRRLVQVFIVDPSESIPLDDCLLHRGELKLTDLTDQELFFEVDIKAILDAHNAKRTKLVDKSVKERTEHLEPARIRDLRMQIVTVATF
jgi:hypothetical protein